MNKISKSVLVCYAEKCRYNYYANIPQYCYGAIVEKGQTKTIKCVKDYYNDARKICEDKVKVKEYQNGTFDFEILLPENRSHAYSSGRHGCLDCLITTEDGIKVIVAVDETILVELLKQNTFVNGKCSSKVVFGRDKGLLGVCTTSMPCYQEYIKKNKAKVKQK